MGWVHTQPLCQCLATSAQRWADVSGVPKPTHRLRSSSGPWLSHRQDDAWVQKCVFPAHKSGRICESAVENKNYPAWNWNREIFLNKTQGLRCTQSKGHDFLPSGPLGITLEKALPNMWKEFLLLNNLQSVMVWGCFFPFYLSLPEWHFFTSLNIKLHYNHITALFLGLKSISGELPGWLLSQNILFSK